MKATTKRRNYQITAVSLRLFDLSFFSKMAQSTVFSEKKETWKGGQTFINPGCFCVCFGQISRAILSDCTFTATWVCWLVPFCCMLHSWHFFFVSAPVCKISVLIWWYGTERERRDWKRQMRWEGNSWIKWSVMGQQSLWKLLPIFSDTGLKAEYINGPINLRHGSYSVPDHLAVDAIL